MKIAVILVALLNILVATCMPTKDSWKLDFPKSRMEFRIEPTELPELKKLLLQFATQERLSVVDNGASLPPKENRAIFDIFLESSREAIEVNVENVTREDQMFIIIHAREDNSKLSGMSARLRKIIAVRWPTLRPYNGP